MIILKGQRIFDGIAIGSIAIYTPSSNNFKQQGSTNFENELLRFQTARQAAIEDLKKLYNKAFEAVGEKNAAIFGAQQMMLEDLDYIESIEALINKQNLSAESAVNITDDKFSALFESMGDKYLQARAQDVHDISSKLLFFLTGKNNLLADFSSPVVLVANELSPSEIMQLDKTKVLGFVTQFGSQNSHAAILARALGLPSVVAVDNLISNAANNMLAVIDGFTGNIYLAPDEKTLNVMTNKMHALQHEHLTLTKLKGKKTISKSGREIKIFANIGSTLDLPATLENDAEGIGLFRSEFLYLGEKSFPTEEQQFIAYKTVAETMSGKPVIIRTLDIGSDKSLPYFNLPQEINPALGYRAIRICLLQPEIFKIQLRAILRASALGNIAIMFPMINSVEELKASKAIVESVKTSLQQENIPFADNIKIGTMIETPAAAIISDDLAKEVDFFSIGTNDLTQYTLALDRQNKNLDTFFNPYHKAVLKLIELTVKNAHKNGISVGICGELSADTKLAQTFLELGVDELSVSPPCILALREKIRSLD
ncbi:MAG: phosphoenolpyruvate--protein phosphotransferase [Acidaminococcaceae bacterium]|nr:phosphoenolpyruvate--protein phosphotransferase [Acidaminococcaceae bacterium]MDD4721957.1 phosphoenolpyruvate--protein phosphotransferase [Acidaminococcaceae bacterium]